MLEFPLSGKRLNRKSPEILSQSCAIVTQEGKITKSYLGVFATQEATQVMARTEWE